MIFEKGYKTFAGNDCFNACIWNYMNYNQILIQEFEIFFLGKGYNLILDINSNKLDIKSTISSSGENFLKSCGFNYTINHAISKANAKKYLLHCIENEKYIILNVMSKKLSYNQVFNIDANIDHTINVIGYNKNNDKLYISDCYVPTIPKSTIYEGWIDLSEIMLAWKLMNYEYITIDFEKSINVSSDIKDRVFKNIEIYLNEYNNIRIDENIWINIILKLDNLFINNDMDENYALKDFLYNINYQLRVNGFMTIKNYILQMLEFNIPNNYLSKEYNNIFNSWNIVCLLLIKLSYTKKHLKYLNLKVIIWELIEREKEFFLELKIWFNKIK